MKAVQLFLMFFSLTIETHAWGTTPQALPDAILTVSTTAEPNTRTGSVSAELLNADSPSCAAVLARERYLEKQIAEIESTIDRHQITETLELRKRLLQLQQMLSSPWATMQARFPINPEWAGPIQSHTYAVAVDIAGRQWTSSQGFLPDGEALDLVGNDLTLKWTWNAYEYCRWKGPVRVELTLLPR